MPAALKRALRCNVRCVATCAALQHVRCKMPRRGAALHLPRALVDRIAVRRRRAEPVEQRFHRDRAAVDVVVHLVRALTAAIYRRWRDARQSRCRCGKGK